MPPMKQAVPVENRRPISVRRELSNVEMRRPPIATQAPPVTTPSLDDLRVLVVDDEPDARELITTVLSGHGADVVSVGSGNEALAEMQRQQFDVLVSDIGMPQMDGYALIERVRKLPSDHGGRIPAAALTAYAGVEDRMRVLSAGYQIHIPKPVEPDELAMGVGCIAMSYARSLAKVN